MKLTVLKFSNYDINSDATVVEHRRSTRERIARIRGTPLEDTAIDVDEKLVNDEGQVLVWPGSNEAKLLKRLSELGGRAEISGNVDRSHARHLVEAGLVTQHAVNADTVEYELTSLGALAIDQLL